MTRVIVRRELIDTRAGDTDLLADGYGWPVAAAALGGLVVLAVLTAAVGSWLGPDVDPPCPFGTRRFVCECEPDASFSDCVAREDEWAADLACQDGCQIGFGRLPLPPTRDGAPSS